MYLFNYICYKDNDAYLQIQPFLTLRHFLLCEWWFLKLLNVLFVLFQVCEQCPNVKFEREGYFVTVDIEKGMQDGQVRNSNLHLDRSMECANDFVLEAECYK